MRTFIITGEYDLLPAVVTVSDRGTDNIFSGILMGLQQVFDDQFSLNTFSADPELPFNGKLTSEYGGYYIVSIEECRPIVIGEPTYDYGDERLNMSEIVAAERLEGFLRSTEVDIKEMVSSMGLTIQEWVKIKAAKKQFFTEDFVEVVDRIMSEEG